MSAIAAEALYLIEILPEDDQLFACEFLRKLARPYQDFVPNSETMEAMTNVKNGVNLSRVFHSVEELMEDLDADDPV